MPTIVRYTTPDGPRIGLLDRNILLPTGLADDSWAAVLAGLNAGELPTANGDPVPDGYRLLAPIISSSRILCVAQNYPAHAEEAGGASPPSPIVFIKPPTAFVGTNDVATIPAISKSFDYEGEIAVVVGRECHDVAPQDADSIIAGYSVGNDGSARDLQPATLADRRQIDWFAAKTSDCGSALGPGVVPRKQVADFSALRIQTDHNGEIVQDDVAASMFHSLPNLIQFLSRILTLQPGDVILTGTPAGVGKARGVFLAPDDTITISVTGLGELHTRYTAAS